MYERWWKGHRYKTFLYMFDSDNPVHVLQRYWKDNVPGTSTKPYRTSFQIFSGTTGLDVHIVAATRPKKHWGRA